MDSYHHSLLKKHFHCVQMGHNALSPQTLLLFDMIIYLTFSCRLASFQIFHCILRPKQNYSVFPVTRMTL